MLTIRDYIDDILNSGISASFNTLNGEIMLGCKEIFAESDEITLSFCNGDARLDVKIIFTENSAMASLSAFTGDEGLCFTADNGIVINFGELKNPDGMRLTVIPYTCFMNTAYCGNYSQMPLKTQSFLAKFGDRHCSAITLCGDNFRTWFFAEGIRLCTDCECISSVNGAFASVSVADDPFVAIDTNYKDARRLGGISVPLKYERVVTLEKFKGLGWCTWNAFEEDFDEDKIFQKLDQFKELNIPIGWVLLDDGWLVHDDDKKLLSLKIDEKKFPHGLKSFVDKVKSYGVEHVGLWHTITAYWYGFVEGSQAYCEQKDNLERLENGMIVPSLDYEKGYRFWDDWYGYFAQNGIDFVKIDSQTSFIEQLKNRDRSVREIMQTVYSYIEKAAMKHFGGDIINTGMDIINIQSRPYTLVARNGEDFWIESQPRAQFRYLTGQNVYNSVSHDKMYHCDYDMWWSTDITATRCGVLRTVSGSINYLSDQKPYFDAEKILPTLDDDGTTFFGDHAGYPTLDCLYGGNGTGIFKVWNSFEGSYGVAVFNNMDEDSGDTLRLDNISGINLDKEYICYEYFSKQFVRMNRNTELRFNLSPDDALAYSLYPIECDDGGEYVMLGNTQKYTGYASKFKMKTYINRII